MKKYLLLFPALVFLSNIVCGQGGIDKPKYLIETHRAGTYLGTFEIELFPLIAPLHVANFDSLVNDQFYDSTAFHRVVPGFVIQGGDPNSINGPISTWGQGQPWQVTVPAEFSVVRHLRGILGAARDVDTNSANSQFYICVANATFLDGNYTVYGKVTNGMNIVDTIVSEPRDPNDVPLQKIEMFITHNGVNDSIPDAPVLSLPADGSTSILNTQSFSWSAVPGAVMYTIELSTDPAFSVISILQESGTNTSLVTNLAGTTTYYWRVKSNNGGHESTYSNVFSFTTATAAPVLLFPPDLATNIVINPVFSWDPVPGADNYTLQVSTTSTFTVQSMVYNTAGLTTTSQQVNGLDPNTLYYWRVRSFSGTTAGFFSVKFSFTTGTTIGVNEYFPMTGFTLFPNPAASGITLNGYMKISGSVDVQITDISGRALMQFPLNIATGSFSHYIDIEKLNSGIYFLEIRSGNQSTVQRFSKTAAGN